MKTRFNKIKYTFKHKLAFLKVEKDLLGRNTFDGYTHDLGKLLMLIFCPFISINKIKKIHDKRAKHHNAKTRMDYIQKVIDYECAHYTKADKQLSARNWVEKDSINRDEETNKHLYETLTFLGL